MISYGRFSRRKLRPQRSLPFRIAAGCLRALFYAFILSVVVVFLLRFFNPPFSAFTLASRFEKKPPPIQREWRPLEAMGLNIRVAVLAAEDQRFWTHWGFDVIEIEDALDDYLDGQRRRGASSITQQTAKNLFLWQGKSFLRKGIEAYFTVLLEIIVPKRRILELYLNFAEFGPGVYGAEAASRVYFRKHSSQLSLHEAALLAAVLPNPKKRSPVNPSPGVSKRVEWIEEQAIRADNLLARDR